MNWRDQIVVERLAAPKTDASVANAARVSFGVPSTWNEIPEGYSEKRMTGLINYLAEHEHLVPFRHCRETFVFNGQPFDMWELTPFEMAGLVVKKGRYGQMKVRTSILGWFQLIRSGKVRPLYAYQILENLHQQYPITTDAFKLEAVTASNAAIAEDTVLHYDDTKETDPEFIDVTFRCKTSLWLAAQLKKHQVNMSWSEVSRRYVKSSPELFNQEFRAVPDGSIKQGSAEVLNAGIPDLVVADIYGDETAVDSSTVQNALVTWYEDCVEAGIAPETIRGFMPYNTMTEWVWTGSLAAWNHMIRLRIDSHAQLEAQVFAQKTQEQL